MAMIQPWLPIVLYMVLLRTAATSFIIAEVTRNEIERQDGVLKQSLIYCESVSATIPLQKRYFKKSVALYATVIL